MKRPKLKPGNDSLMELPFLKPEAVPEFDELFTSLDDIDGLIRDAASLTTAEDLLRDAPTIKQDIASLLSPNEENVSRLLGCYAVQKPARRCHRPRRRREA